MPVPERIQPAAGHPDAAAGPHSSGAIGGIDMRALQALCRGLGGEHAAAAFLRRYLNLMPGRLADVVAALTAHSSDRALDRLLSLKTASAMVGANGLAAVCGSAEGAVRTGGWQQAGQLLPELTSRAADVVIQLTATLADPSWGTP